MSRPVTGSEFISKAKDAVANAETADQLRVAQAVLLPLQDGLTLEQTAQIVGRSVGWVARKRREFILNDGVIRPPLPRGGWRYSLLDQDEEFELIKSAIMQFRWKSQEVINREIRRRLEERLGRDLSESTLRSILIRFGRKVWRKEMNAGSVLGGYYRLVNRWQKEALNKIPAAPD